MVSLACAARSGFDANRVRVRRGAASPVVSCLRRVCALAAAVVLSCADDGARALTTPACVNARDFRARGRTRR